MADGLDPLDLLREIAVRETQEITPPAALRVQVEATAAQCHQSMRSRLWRWLTRRRLVVGGVLIAVLGGSVATAAWLSGQPGSPEAGIVCRAAASQSSDQYLLDPNADPLTACADVWLAGILPNPEDPQPANATAPPLAACVGDGGAIEVYPAADDVCSLLGLLSLETEPDLDLDLVAEMQSRVVGEVNASERCFSASEVADELAQLFSELELKEWSIVIGDEIGQEGCAKATVESEAKRVVVFFVPTPP